MAAQIGPGIQGAYEGFFQGLDMVRGAKRAAADDEWVAKGRSRDQAMWAERDELERARLSDSAADLQDKAQLRPQSQEYRTKKLAVGTQELTNMEKELDLSGAKLDNEAKHIQQTLQDSDIAKAVHSAQTGQQALTSFMQLGGEALDKGDLPGVTKIMGHLVNSKLIDAGGMGTPVSTQLVNIPKDEGALDFSGQPIAGQALKVITDTGSEVYVNPLAMRSAYKSALNQQEAERAKVIKPGEKWMTPNGQVLAEGAPRVTGGIVVDPETGDVIDMRPRASGSGSGSGSGARGKEPKGRVDQAMEHYATISQKGESKHDADTIAAGQVFTERAAQHEWLTPAEAAYVGARAATGGEKALQPYLDPNTLQITGAYSDPSVQGGRPVPLAPGSISLQDYASTPVGKAAGQKALAQATEMYLRTTPAQNEDQRNAVRNLLVQAAADDGVRDKLLNQLQGGDPSKLAHLQRLIDAQRAFGAPTSQAKPTPSKAPIATASAATLPPQPATQPGNALGGINGATRLRAADDRLPAGGMYQEEQTPQQTLPATSQDQRVANLTTEAIAAMGREDVRKVFNDSALMRQLSNQQRNALLARWSKF